MPDFSAISTINLFIIVCIAILLLMLIPNPLKLFLILLKQTAVGAALMFGLNFVLAPFSIFVSINVLTLAVVGLLGVPGVISMYVLQVMF